MNVTICGILTALPQADFNARLIALGTTPTAGTPELRAACAAVKDALRSGETITAEHPAMIAVAAALTLPGGEAPVMMLPGDTAQRQPEYDLRGFLAENGVQVRPIGGGR